MDESDTYYPGCVVGKLEAIDPDILTRLRRDADRLLEKYKETLYFRMKEEEGNPFVPNPFILLENAFRAAANLGINAFYKPAHINYPDLNPIPNPYGREMMIVAFPVYTKIRVMPRLAEAAIAYIDRDRDAIMEAAGITFTELRDLRAYARSEGMETLMAVKP